MNEPSKRGKQFVWKLYYLIDWFLIFGIFIITFFFTRIIIRDPHHRYLSKNWVDDGRFDYPFISETITLTSLLLFFIVPIVIIIGWNFFKWSNFFASNHYHDIHHGLLSLFVGFIIPMCFVEMIKWLVGSHRPNFKGMCEPDEKGNCSNVNFKKSEGMQSFPSGHACAIFSMMTFTTLYLCGKLGIFKGNGISLIKSLLVLVPIIIAVIVSVSRIRDYYHHFVDVVCGSIIGVCGSAFAYFIYYHSLFDEKSHLPRNRYEEKSQFNVTEPKEILFN